MSNIGILTGATGGLGQAFAVQLLKEDIDEIWAVARNIEKLNQLKAKYGAKIRPIQCDLSKPGDLSELSRLMREEKP